MRISITNPGKPAESLYIIKDLEFRSCKNIEFKIVAYLPRFLMLIFVKFYVFVYRILLYSVI